MDKYNNSIEKSISHTYEYIRISFTRTIQLLNSIKSYVCVCVCKCIFSKGWNEFCATCAMRNIHFKMFLFFHLKHFHHVLVSFFNLLDSTHTHTHTYSI